MYHLQKYFWSAKSWQCFYQAAWTTHEPRSAVVNLVMVASVYPDFWQERLWLSDSNAEATRALRSARGGSLQAQISGHFKHKYLVTSNTNIWSLQAQIFGQVFEAIWEEEGIYCFSWCLEEVHCWLIFGGWSLPIFGKVISIIWKLIRSFLSTLWTRLHVSLAAVWRRFCVSQYLEFGHCWSQISRRRSFSIFGSHYLEVANI